jgi:type I restriction enzyme R subunit
MKLGWYSRKRWFEAAVLIDYYEWRASLPAGSHRCPAQLDKLIRVNHTRANFLSKFEELIESYNAGSRSIDDLFKELLALSRALSDEQQRHVREQLTEDELTVFDLLTRPGPNLSTEERGQVKKVTRQLLERRARRPRPRLASTWTDRAQVLNTIKDTLDEGLPRA